MDGDEKGVQMKAQEDKNDDEMMLSQDQKVFWHAIDNVNEDEIRK